MYNITSTSKLEIDTKTPYNKRAKLDTGTHCNYKCGFCYYKENLDVQTPLETIKNRVDYLVECGITEVDLSGGESSIHKHWFEILDYCKSKNLKISCLSNGRKFSDIKFLEKSQKHGLQEILFSLHGDSEETHDKIVGAKGAFTHMTKAIVNAEMLDIKVRVNCTVTLDNVHHLDTKYVILIKMLNPTQLNFLTLNYWSDAKNQEVLDYTTSTNAIKKTIDELKDYVPEINVRYTPYCFMKGYEKYVVNYYQHIYDLKDWNIAVYDERTLSKDYIGNELKHLYSTAKDNRLQSYKKNKECLKCKYYYICDGYENKIDDIKLFPEDGDKITEVNYYRK